MVKSASDRFALHRSSYGKTLHKLVVILRRLGKNGMEGNWNGSYKGTGTDGNSYKYNGKEFNNDYGLNWYHYGARFYDPAIGRWSTVDPSSEKDYECNPYHYVYNNPIKLIDPDGREAEYPIITITNVKSGETADQAVLGYSGGANTKVDLYRVTVTDNEDANFKMDFLITRDAWTVENKGDSEAKNVGFEPKNAQINHFTGAVMPNGYPEGNGTEALKLMQKKSEVVHAEPNQTSVNMKYRTKKDVASGVMIHVGGNHEKAGKTKVAASEGCFGIVNSGNSKSKTSNTHSNDILTKIKNQADKSKTAPGHIRVIIQKREDNEYPKTKKIN